MRLIFTRPTTNADHPKYASLPLNGSPPQPLRSLLLGQKLKLVESMVNTRGVTNHSPVCHSQIGRLSHLLHHVVFILVVD